MIGLVLMVAALGVQDTVQVRARLSDEQVRAGETTTLRVDVETQGARPQIQHFTTLPPGLELVGTRDYDQRQFSLPGGVRRFVSREFVLRARATGRYRIPEVRVIVDGRTYATPSSLLTVTAAPARERGETREGSDGVLLRAWLDSDTVFVGEQVTLEVEAMFSQDARLRLRRAPEYEPPSPSGFWIHDIPDHQSPITRMIGGDLYEVQRFRRAFFPLSTGSYELPPAHLEYEIRRGLLYAPESHTIASDELPLVVLPVPEAGQPPEFTGAVGRYTVRGWLEPARVPAGEATVLTVEVSGIGNVKALPPPRLPEMEGMEAFPPSEEAETDIVGSTVRGSKRFSWVLIPRQAGERVVPEIPYAYFDPATGSYETVAVGEMTLEVEPGTTVSDDAAPATLRYLAARPSGSDPLGFVRSSWFAALQALPLLLLAGALALRRRRDRGGAASPSALRRQRRTEIRDLARRADAGDRGVFADADAFARRWLAERLGLERREASDAGALTAAGVSAATVSALRAALDRLSAARYAPEPPTPPEARDLVRTLGRVLELVEHEVGGRRWGAGPGRAPRAAAGAGAVLLLLLAPSLGGGAAAAQSVGTFEEGVARFDAGRYADAATAFDAYVRERPGDPAGWYNLGTAYHRAGFDGYAVWAWLQGLRLDPRNADTRHNLRVAGAAPELVAEVTPALPLRPTEMLFVASLAWLVAGVAGAWWVLARRRGSAMTSVVALLLAIGIGSAWLDSTDGTGTLIVLEEAPLRAGPNLRGEALTALPPGTGLRLVEAHQDWLRARVPGGQEGWIESRWTGRIGGP